MAPTLIDPGISALSLAVRASDPTMPFPETMCYKLPFGLAGFINNVITIYMVICLAHRRMPLFPWRRLRFDSLATGLSVAWGLLLLVAYGVNFGGCLRSGGAALIMIIVGKMAVGLYFVVCIVVGVAKKKDASKMKAQAQAQDDDAGNAGGETEDAAMADGATEAEAAAESDTAEPPEVSPTAESGTVTAGGDSQIAEAAPDPSPAVSPTDLAEPPPAYEAIFRQVFPATSLFSANAKQAPPDNTHPTDLENQHASSSCDAGTQTADLPPLSPTAAAEALSTDPTTPEPAKPARPPRPPPIDNIPGVVFFLLGTGFMGLVLVGAIILYAKATGAGNKAAGLSLLLLTLCLIPSLVPIMARVVSWTVRKAWEAWMKSGVEKGAYTELEDVEEGNQGLGTDGSGAGGRQDAASGSELVMDHEADGDVGRLAKGHSGIGGKEESEIGGRVSDAAEPAQAEPAAELTHATGDPPVGRPKSRLRIPVRDAAVVVLVGGVSMWVADFAIGEAADNMLGLPSENTWTLGWVLYILASKLPMLSM